MLKLFARPDALRQEVDLQRALRHAPQAEPYHLAQKMGALGEIFTGDSRVDLNIAERIEVLDRYLEFFLKKSVVVRNDRTAPGQQQPQRWAAALLTFVKVDRPGHFGVQPRHHIADDLTDPRLLFVGGFLISAAEGDEALCLLHLLSFKKGDIELGGDALCDCIAGNG